MSDAESLAEARELSELLIASSELARSIFGEIANELEIPVSISRALCAMDSAAPMSELAGKLHCDKSYVTSLADQLESMALIERVPGPDRRIKILELTATGTTLRDELERRVARLTPAMTELTADERKTLKTLLEKISTTK